MISRNSLSKQISNMWKWNIFLWPSSIYLCLSQADLNHLWNSFKLLVLLLCDTIMFHTVNVYLLGLNHLKLSAHTIFSSRRIVLLCTLTLRLTKASCFVIDHLSSFKWISCSLFIYLFSQLHLYPHFCHKLTRILQVRKEQLFFSSSSFWNVHLGVLKLHFYYLNNLLISKFSYL